MIANGTVNEMETLSKEMLSVVATNEKTHVDRDLSRNRPLRAQIDVASNNNRVSDEARRVRCLQVLLIFRSTISFYKLYDSYYFAIL